VVLLVNMINSILYNLLDCCPYYRFRTAKQPISKGCNRRDEFSGIYNVMINSPCRISRIPGVPLF
jgi:hypothetical protein